MMRMIMNTVNLFISQSILANSILKMTSMMKTNRTNNTPSRDSKESRFSHLKTIKLTTRIKISTKRSTALKRRESQSTINPGMTKGMKLVTDQTCKMTLKMIRLKQMILLKMTNRQIKRMKIL